MAKTFKDKLFDILKQNPDFLDQEGELLLERVVDSAYNVDPKLIELLLGNADIKKKFFSEIKKHWVFNINDFVMFVQDKHFLNDSYTAFKNKIGLNIGGKFMNERKEVALVWPFKDCVLEGGMTKEDQNKKEIFFNEILAQDEIDKLYAPKVLTNWKRYTKKGEEEVKELKRDENGTIKENLLIKGNNLLALHTLKEQFRGKVKLIYIDPPFNTGNDSFNYNDSFSHSTWMTFMKNRLEVARELLSKDGSIFVHLDFNESHYCKLLLDEVFGVEKFKNNIVWCYTGPAGATNFLPRKHDDILWYGKSEVINFNMPYIQHKSGVHNTGQVFGDTKERDSFKEEIEAKGKKLEDWWIDIYSTDRYRSEKVDFSGQKPERLLRRIIEMVTSEGDIVLDYHLGSGTTAGVSHKLNRQYIGVEQLDYGKNDSVERLRNVVGGDKTGISKDVNWRGGGDFVRCELMKYNESFVDQIKKAKDTKALLKVWEQMKEKAFFKHNFEMQEFEKNFDEFKKQNLKDQKKLLFDILDKNQLYVNYSEIDDNKFKVEKRDKIMNEEFYGE